MNATVLSDREIELVIERMIEIEDAEHFNGRPLIAVEAAEIRIVCEVERRQREQAGSETP
jgi:hypothetical protein